MQRSLLGVRWNSAEAHDSIAIAAPYFSMVAILIPSHLCADLELFERRAFRQIVEECRSVMLNASKPASLAVFKVCLACFQLSNEIVRDVHVCLPALFGIFNFLNLSHGIDFYKKQEDTYQA